MFVVYFHSQSKLSWSEMESYNLGWCLWDSKHEKKKKLRFTILNKATKRSYLTIIGLING